MNKYMVLIKLIEGDARKFMVYKRLLLKTDVEWRAIFLMYAETKLAYLTSTEDYASESERKRILHWVETQIEEKKAGELSDASIRVLNSIGFRFSKKDYDFIGNGLGDANGKTVSVGGFKKINSERYVDSDWLKMYNKLVKYRGRFGDCDVRLYSRGDVSLYNWVLTQKELKNSGKLSTVYIDMLDKIGFNWSNIDNLWSENYNKFKMFVIENKVIDDIGLYTMDKYMSDWCRLQVYLHSQGLLSIDKVTLLKRVYSDFFVVKKGFCINDKDKPIVYCGYCVLRQTDKVWNTRYGELVKEIKDNGFEKNANLRQYNFNMYNWIETQKKSYKDGKLCRRRYLLLDSLIELGFKWK